MYIYLVVFLMIYIMAILSLKIKFSSYLVYFFLFILTFMLTFRYGQGTDYFTHAYIILQNRTYDMFLNNNFGEIGFRALAVVFQGNYIHLFAIFSLFEMSMLYRFLNKHCVNKMFSLMLFVPTIYMMYYFSLIRQGIVIAGFLGIGITLIEEKKWIYYTFLCLILSTIHTVAIVLLTLPLIITLKYKLLTRVILPFAIVVGIIFLLLLQDFSLFSFIPLAGHINYYLKYSATITSISERFITLLIVLMFYSYSSYNKKGMHPWWIKAYIWGHVIFFFFMPFSTFANRLFINFKVLEIMFIPILLTEKNRFNQIIKLYFILLPLVMYMHNTTNLVHQGLYNSNVNAINYPYISVFDKNKLWSYRMPNSAASLVEWAQ